MKFNNYSATQFKSTLSKYKSLFMGVLMAISLVGSSSAQVSGGLDGGGATDWVSVPHAASLAVETHFTIECWFNYTYIAPGDERNLVEKGRYNGDWLCFIKYKYTGDVGHKLCLVSYGWSPGEIYGNTTLQPNTWYHYAATYDGTTRKIYLNGVLDAMDTPSGALYPNTNMIGIGAGGDGTYNFPGKMDEVRIWNYARTAGEIASTYNTELAHASTGAYPGLVAYYQFNQGTPFSNNAGITTLIDSSGYGNHGTLNNYALSGCTSNWSCGAPAIGGTCAVDKEISILGNATVITDEDNTPDVSDSTDFNFSDVGLPTTRRFYINNSGAGTLTLSSTVTIGGTNAADFVVTTQPATSIASGASTFFDVAFTPSSNGLKTASISVDNDDCDESTYNFSIKGYGGCPVFTACPASPITQNVDSGFCTAVINYTSTAIGTPTPTPTYSFTGATTLTGAGTGSGSAFNVGTTTVTITATSACGSPATCIFDVVISDPQVLSCPSDITQNNDGGQCNAVINYSVGGVTGSTAYALSGATTGSGSGTGSGLAFNIGTTNVALTSTSLCGATSNCSFNVTINDDQTISFPSNITQVTDFGQCNASVNYYAGSPSASTTYVFSGATTGSGSGIGAGSVFNKGTTTVTITSTTDCGTPTNGTFTVTVNDAQPPIANSLSATINVGYGDTIHVDGSILNNISTDNCGVATLECLKQASSGIASRNYLNSQYSGGSASIVSFNAIAPASNYSSIGFACNDGYEPQGTLCNDSQADDPTVSIKGGASGATWSSGGSTGKGVLVYDMGQANAISRLAVFQMFSDGKTTHFKAYSHASTGTAPAYNDAGWDPLFSEGFVGPGALQSGNTVINPTNFDFPLTNTRYLKFEVRNDGTHGSGSYIELRAVKAFGPGMEPCTFTCANVGATVPVQLKVTDINGNSSYSATTVTINNTDINVKGNGMPIALGATTTNEFDYTNFGSASIDSVITKTFYVHNVGTGLLGVNNVTITGADASKFTVTLFPSSSISGGDSSMFKVSFSSNTIGLSNATATVVNNNCDESNYSFAISAYVATVSEALNFDGVDDYVATANVVTNNLTNVTMEGWFKWSGDNSHYQNLFYNGTSSSSGYGVIMMNGTLVLVLGNSNYQDAGISLDANQWTHVALVNDGTNWILYKNGVAVMTTAITGVAPVGVTMIGGNPLVLAESFSGSIDEVRIWNRALCQGEIAGNSNGEIPTSETDLVANYHFNQGVVGGDNTSEASLNDASGNANNGTLNNFTLNGTSSNWVLPGSIVPGTAITLAAKIDFKNATNTVAIANGASTALMADGTDFGSVAVGATAENFYRVNNVGNNMLTISNITISGPDAADFTIGTQIGSGVAVCGNDQFSLVFTPSSFGTKNAIIYFNTDDANYPTYSFVIQGQGQTNNALAFDGVDDHIDIPYNSGFSAGSTFAAWIKTSENIDRSGNVYPGNSGMSILGGSTDAGQTIGITNGKLELNAYVNTPPYTWTAYTGNTNVNDGNWHHVAVTESNDGFIVLYVDGVVDANYSAANGFDPNYHGFGSIGASYKDASSVAGGNAGPRESFFKGEIDEWIYMAGVQTQSKIDSIRTMGVNPSNPSVYAYYNFNQNQAYANNVNLTVLNDLDPTAHNGALIGFALNGCKSNYVCGAPALGSTCLQQEINVLGNGNSITDGDTANVLIDSDFGTPNTYQPVVKTFTITNSGTGDLIINGITVGGQDSTLFAISNAPSQPIAAGGTATFDVTFTADTAGVKNSTVHISSNDCDEDFFDFNVRGEGVIPPAGNALDFDGTNDYVEVPHNPSMNVTELTIEANVFYRGSGFQNVVMKGSYGYGVAIDNGTVEFWDQYAGGQGPNSTIGAVPANQWTHIAVTVGGGIIKFYINGVLNNTTSENIINNNTDPLIVGRQGTTCGCNFFNGKIDELRIWNRALTQSEIEAGRHCDIPQQSGLVSCLRFNQGTPDSINTGLANIVDYSTNLSCGTLNNFALTGNTSNWTAGVYGNCNPISIPTSVTATVSILGASTFCTGDSAILVATGGTNYSWSNGVVNDSITVSTSGFYIVNAASGCVSDTASQNIIAGTNPMVVMNATDVLCNGESTGSVTPGVSGGTGSYNYVWNTGATTASLTNVTQGIYTVTVTEVGSGCGAVNSINVNEPAALIANLTTQNESCNNADGYLIVGVVGGVAPYSILWSNGDTSNSISNLSAGIYTVQVSDSNGCVLTNADTVSRLGIVNMSGLITAQAVPTNAGHVILYEVNDTAAYGEVEIAQIGLSGNYSFAELRTDKKYIVAVIPDSIANPNAVVTYHTHTHRWDSATVIQPVCYNNVLANINLIELLPQAGTGVISGVLIDASDSLNQRRPGEPVIGVDVSVEQIPGGSQVMRTTSDTNGVYTLTQVPDGMYMVYVNVPGCNMTTAYEVTISGTNTISNQVYYVDSIHGTIDTSTTLAVILCNYSVDFTTAATCFGTPTQFNDLTTYIGYKVDYSWDFENDGTINDHTKGDNAYVYPAPGTYTARLNINSYDGVCSDFTMVQVQVYNNPNVSLSLFSDTACSNGGLITLTGGLPANGVYSGVGVVGADYDPTLPSTSTDTVYYTYVDNNGCSAQAFDVFTIDICLGVNEKLAAKNVIEMYPNPTTGILNINAQNMDEDFAIEIRDVKGAIVYKIDSAKGTNGSINLQNLDAAVYSVHFIGTNFSSVQKLVIN